MLEEVKATTDSAVAFPLATFVAASAAFCGSVACRECNGRTAEIKLDFICP